MQPADTYHNLLKLFSESFCVNMSKIGREVADEILSLGIAYVGFSQEICVKSIVHLAMLAAKRGCDPKKVSAYLSWRDFEDFVASALSESDYEVFKNLRFGKRRLEFDVLAISTPSSLGIAVDCKHWSPKYVSSGKIRDVAVNHLKKLKEFLEWCGYEIPNYPQLRNIKSFIGVVVTMSESIRGSVEGVIVVPIYYFRDFTVNLRYYIDELKAIILQNPCYLRNSR